MFLVNGIQDVIDAGRLQLVSWVTGILPQVFLFLILLNALTRLVGRARVERLAARCGSNAFLRYLVLPFLSAVILGNPMAISMGRYLPERYKPAYFASASYHCHTNSGIFHHINPAELFLWLGIANGLTARGLDLFPLAVLYLCAGLLANFVSGYSTELITKSLEKKTGIRLEGSVDLRAECSEGAGSTAGPQASFRSITIECGDGGWGGPVTVTPTKARHTVVYMTGGGLEPEPLSRILALSGMKAVNGTAETVPDEEVALAIIDCGGTLRCGIYPRKGIPTVNLLATGRSGPLAKYMTEDLYVSAVSSDMVFPARTPSGSPAPEADLPSKAPAPEAALPSKAPTPEADLPSEAPTPEADLPSEAPAPEADLPSEAPAPKADLSAEVPGIEKDADKDTEKKAAGSSGLLRSAALISRIVSVFHQSARDAVRTCLDMLLPFMGFAALFVGICRGSGLTELLASSLQPMGGSLPGLLGLGVICSIPGLSAVLGAGAVAAQMFSTVIGDLIAAGSIAPAMALPALFAVNCQCACDFIPVGLGMTEARPETTQIGITAVTLSRFATGWIRILIALAFSLALYR